VIDNGQEDLRKQNICERNLAKGRVYFWLSLELDLQCRRFINQWNEYKFLKKYYAHSR
jgi:hypothetical protein